MKGQIGWTTVVRIVIGVLLVVLAFSIGRSCAEAILPSVSESVTSFNNFADAIEKTNVWERSHAEKMTLVMDQGTAIFGFAKGSLAIDKIGLGPYQIVRPKICGDKNLACICLCQKKSLPIERRLNGGIHDPESDSCYENTLRCRSLHPTIDFKPEITVMKMVPLGVTPVHPLKDNPPSSIKWGFIFERQQDFPYFLSDSLIFQGKDVIRDEDVSIADPFPRRFTISIEKTSDQKLAICARPPCI